MSEKKQVENVRNRIDLLSQLGFQPTLLRRRAFRCQGIVEHVLSVDDDVKHSPHPKAVVLVAELLVKNVT